MKYFFIDTLGDLDDEELCFLAKTPKGIGIKYYKLMKGLPIGGDYPHPAEIHMSEEYEGLKLASLIGHVKSYLVLERQVVQVIQKYCPGIVIEYLPFTLINHKGRVHSEDYFIVNPIGSFDCLNHKSSQITYHKKEISRIDRYMLDSDKLKSAPALFRIPEMPDKYIINEELAKAFDEHGFTNIVLTEIAQK